MQFSDPYQNQSPYGSALYPQMMRQRQPTRFRGGCCLLNILGFLLLFALIVAGVHFFFVPLLPRCPG